MRKRGRRRRHGKLIKPEVLNKYGMLAERVAPDGVFSASERKEEKRREREAGGDGEVEMKGERESGGDGEGEMKEEGGREREKKTETEER